MRPGYDLLGMAHPLFPFKRILEQIPKDAPIGWFWNTFGPSKDLLKYMLDSGYTIFRPQMWWSNSHAIVPLNVLEVTLKELREVTDGKNIRLYVSPSCEHAEKDSREVKARIDLVRKIIPSAIPVNNPWTGAVLKGVLTERHGGEPGRCELASCDGTNCYDLNAAKWIREYGNREHPCFLWGYRFNLREITDPGQKPPPIKDRKAAPNVQYFNSIKRLAEDKGLPPKPDFKAEKFRKPNIYKTHAEDDQEFSEDEPDEARENRPVLIIKSSAPAVDILDKNRTVLGRFPRYGSIGSFQGGLTRYYSAVRGGLGLYGFEIGNLASSKSGSEFVWFRAGKSIYGPVHPAFRAGVFR